MLLTAGCALVPVGPSTSYDEFEAMRATLRDSQEARTAFLDQCASDLSRSLTEQKRPFSIIMDVREDDVVPLFCQRYTAALVSGQIAYAEFAAFDAEEQDPDALRSLIRALRDPGLGLAL